MSGLAGSWALPVPAIVRDLSDDEMALYVPVENLQRRNFNPIEEARTFKTLQERGWTQQKIADEVGHGVTRDIVGQRLRLLGFPPELQQLVSHDTITPAHAEALARLADKPPIQGRDLQNSQPEVNLQRDRTARNRTPTETGTSQ